MKKLYGDLCETFEKGEFGGIKQKEYVKLIAITIYIFGENHRKLKRETAITRITDLMELSNSTVPEDYTRVNTNKDGRGIPRMVHHIDWSRKHMVDKDLLSTNSPKGIWELTDGGIQYSKKILPSEYH